MLLFVSLFRRCSQTSSAAFSTNYNKVTIQTIYSSEYLFSNLKRHTFIIYLSFAHLTFRCCPSLSFVFYLLFLSVITSLDDKLLSLQYLQHLYRVLELNETTNCNLHSTLLVMCTIFFYFTRRIFNAFESLSLFL